MVSSDLKSACDTMTPDRRPVRLTLGIGIVFGAVLVVLAPPFQSPDEMAHFYRAYECSEGRVYSQKVDTWVGNDMPVSLWKTVWETTGGGDEGRRRFKFSWPKTREALSMPLEPDRREYRAYCNTARFSPVCYLPQAVGMAAARLAGLSPLLIYDAGRLANLIAYVILAAAAVRWMPVQKWTAALLVLAPLPVFLAAHITADAPTNGVGFLAIAMVLHYALRAERVTLGGLLVLVGVFAVLALLKQGYLVLSLLFFAIPAAKFGGRRQFLLSAIVVIGIPVALCAAWSLSVMSLNVPLSPKVDVVAQMRYIVTHPLHYCWALVKALVLPIPSFEGVRVYWDTVGVLGCQDLSLPRAYQDLYLPWMVYPVYWLALVATASLDADDTCQVSATVKKVSFALFVVASLMVATLTYLSWCNVGASSIAGLQARYWVPFMPLVLLPLHGWLRKYQNDRVRLWMPVFVRSVLWIAILSSIHAIVRRYYL